LLDCFKVYKEISIIDTLSCEDCAKDTGLDVAPIVGGRALCAAERFPQYLLLDEQRSQYAGNEAGGKLNKSLTIPRYIKGSDVMNSLVKEDEMYELLAVMVRYHLNFKITIGSYWEHDSKWSLHYNCE
jgi:Ubiquitin carboxyl-terminal hydrolase